MARHPLLGAVRSARGIPRWLLYVGVLLSLLFVVMAVFAPLIAPYGFDQYTSGGTRFDKLAGPDSHHWMGTTVQSLDVLSRVVFGARTALEVVVLAVVVSIVIGVPLGLLSGYRGGWLDRVLVLVTDALFAFPYLLLAIVIAFVLAGGAGGGVVTAATAITVVYVPQYFRVVRASTLSAREATYVEAARALGAKPSTVVVRYLFSNVVQSVPVIATLNAADAILTLAGLGFLGYGIQPTEAAEWGYDLQRAISDAGAGIWWTALYPGLAITLLVVALTLVGEGLNEVLNPSLRRRGVSAAVTLEEATTR
ncbi:peptide/nickel transport system permease protein [Motilibacter peucedani]|uniref:Peptide/nickel transport system permease protein n=1 Tax=Motilibacter peucedani TaxID=598650 RepID=A0A420XTE0_9ACTN|nr:ABC transporter permease [Motilibacter peucedani]RKS80098.1 peptide/nickel transport system permease protein [Motilibacter peucedani]